jgi:hypothetical protein
MDYDVTYLEERIIHPLKQAVTLLREEQALKQRIQQAQGRLDSLENDAKASERKQAEVKASIERLQQTLNEQRQDLHRQLHEERQAREQERIQFDRIREQLKEEGQLERERLAKIQKDRELAEKELDSIRSAIGKKLEALQGVAR